MNPPSDRSRVLPALLALLALVGCGGRGDGESAELINGSPPPPPTADHESGEPLLELRDFRFTPRELRVTAAGGDVELVNTGRAPHTLTIPDLGVHVVLGSGETTRIALDAAPGSYDFLCQFHEDQGMTGVLILEPGAV